MKNMLKLLSAVVLATGLFAPDAFAASTPGGAKLTATINDLGASSSSSHYAVVWVTKADNTFITTLWKQGASSFTSCDLDPALSHVGEPARQQHRLAGGSGRLHLRHGHELRCHRSLPACHRAAQATRSTLPGTARTPSGVVVADGNYKFWIEYAEDAGTHGTDTGGLTPSGLTFTKGPSSSTVNPPNQGTVGTPSGGFNFTSMSIVWTPSVPATFTSVRAEGTKLVMSGTGPANGTYAVLTSTSASASAGQWTPIATNSFSAGGTFSYTNTLDPGVPQTFYRLRVP